MNLTSVPLQVDLHSCDREPIHLPSAIQPHGVLLVLDRPDGHIRQISANACKFAGLAATGGDIAAQDLLGKNISEFLDRSTIEIMRRSYAGASMETHPHFLEQVRIRGSQQSWAGTVHRIDQLCVLEIQAANADPFAPVATSAAVRRSITELDTCRTLASFCQATAERFRTLTGFDRAMVYKFMPDGSGIVIGEARAESLPPYLGLRYPASDIPVQARALYVRNPFRLTADVDAPPVAIIPALNPQTGKPLDMSLCALRATSPVHIEYLRNMGVAASLSFSILHEGQLWGLVACHHMTPRTVPQDARIAGEILARLVSLQVGLKEEAEHKEYVARLAETRTALSDRLRDTGDFVSALTTIEPHLLTGMAASGAALCTGSRIVTLGVTPEPEQIQCLADWVHSQPWTSVWSTNQLSSQFEPASKYVTTASGLLVVRLARNSPEAVLWFRPEVIQHVDWAGDPRKPVESNGNEGSSRLHPRRSFALWREEVRAKAAPWQSAEIAFASDLHESMLAALLQHRSTEITRLNNELLRSNRELEQFASVASHDLQEPLRTVSSYTQLILRRSELKNDPDAQSMGLFIVDAVKRMSALITNLLQFAQAGKQQRSACVVTSEYAVRTAIENLESLIQDKHADVRISELPRVCAQEEQLARVFQNLIANSIKYSRENVTPVVEVSAQPVGANWEFRVEDNGLGFDPADARKIFDSFSRLHAHHVSGTGLGLAICRRIVESFGGHIWATTQPGMGSIFCFTLPGVDSAPPLKAKTNGMR